MTRMIGKLCALEYLARIITLIALLSCCGSEISAESAKIQDQIVRSRSIYVAAGAPTPRRQKELPPSEQSTGANDALAQDLAQFDDRLETSGQLVESSSPAEELAWNVTSLLQTIKSQTNQTRAAGSGGIEPVERLDRDFISLFDELWLIKNSSVAALVQLQFFDNQTLARVDTVAPVRTARRNKTSTLGPLCASSSPAACWPTADSNNQAITLSGKLAVQSKQESLARRKLAEAAARVNGWLSGAQRRLVLAKEKLSQAVLGKLYGAPANKWSHPPDSRAIANGGGGGVDDPRPGGGASDLDGDGPGASRRRRRKRDAPTPSPGQELAAPAECNRLTIDEERTCRDQEQLINANLNLSFPGTPRAIEENCQHITQLLANCWPAQLAQLKQSLSPWSDNLLVTAASASAPVSAASAAALAPSGTPEVNATEKSLFVENSCGLEPRSPQYIRDRVSWMWLNLCIDKRFRQDYIDNLRCLSSWSQEKAQQACNHDYRRMQTYLAGQAGHGFEWTSTSRQGNSRASAAGEVSPPAARQLDGSSESQVEERRTAAVTVGVIGATSGPGGGGEGGREQLSANRQLMSESELVVREVNSKLLCCMFDQFLRCVHRQAVRDCTRRGAQFVVNFLSRIGTDDMKHLCNSESRASVAAASGSGNSGASRPAGRTPASPVGSGAPPNNKKPGSTSDRSPFIESNYCSEPRIQAALANNGPDGGRGAGLGGGSSAPAPPGVGSGIAKSQASQNGAGRHNSQRPGTSHLSHDPTFFGTYTMPSSSSCSSADGDIGAARVALAVLFSTTLAIFMSPRRSSPAHGCLCL